MQRDPSNPMVAAALRRERVHARLERHLAAAAGAAGEGAMPWEFASSLTDCYVCGG